MLASALLLTFPLLAGQQLPQAHAQTPVMLPIVEEPLTVAADGVYSVTVDVRGLDPDGEVAVTIYGVLDDVEQLDADPSRPIHRHSTGPLVDAAVLPDGNLEIRLPIRSGDAGDTGDQSRLWIPEAGVHPVDIAVRDAEGIVASARTLLIRLPRADDERADTLPVAVVLGVGSSDGDVGRSGGVTPAQATALLAERPELEVAILLGDGVLAELRSDPGLARAFATAVGDRPVVTVSEPHLDPSALAAVEHGDLYHRAIETMDERLEMVGLQPAVAIATIDGRPTSRGAGLLLDRGARVALDVQAADGLSGSMVVDGRSLHLLDVVGDTEVLAEGRPSHRAQRSLARALLTATDDDEGEPIPELFAVIDPIDSPLPTLGPLLDELGRGDVLASVSLVDAAPALAAVALRPAPSPQQALDEVAPTITEARRLLETYRSYYAGGAGDPADVDRTLLAALDVAITPTDRQRRVESVVEGLRAELGSIALPADQTVTLAARSAPIPLTIDNGAAGPRQIMLRFRSDKFVVAEEGRLIEVEPGVSSIDLHLEARSLGMSPLHVTALSPDGQRVLATTRFEVRSTAIPGIGLLITGAGLVLLAVWWYVSIRRRRAGDPTPSLQSGATATDRSTSDDRDGALAGGSVGT